MTLKTRLQAHFFWTVMTDEQLEDIFEHFTVSEFRSDAATTDRVENIGIGHKTR